MSRSHGYENRHGSTVASDAYCYGRVLLLPAWDCMSIRLPVFSSCHRFVVFCGVLQKATAFLKKSEKLTWHPIGCFSYDTLGATECWCVGGVFGDTSDFNIISLSITLSFFTVVHRIAMLPEKIRLYF